MNDTPRSGPKPSQLLLSILSLLAGLLGYIVWERGFREHPQPDWVRRDDPTRFMYGSIGAEKDAGIPYWIFYVLPRMFAEKLPGPGGYAAIGLPWEEGQELPIGFTKKTLGFPRVANNCALCHTARYRTAPDAKPVFAPLGPGHTTNIQAFLRFVIDCAKDPRFNSDNILQEIENVTRLDWVDTLMYRFFIIPGTKQRLLERESQYPSIYRTDVADWGRGRDDIIKLFKYSLNPIDDTFGPADFPAIWNLKKYDSTPGERDPQRMNLAGDTWDAYSVVMDSALGLLGGAPHDSEELIEEVQWITDYAKRTPPPAYPFPIDTAKAADGQAVFDAQCAFCHAENSGRVGRALPLVEIGTSRGRLDRWIRNAAVRANRAVAAMGIERRGLVEEDLIGYKVPHLDGIWLRPPYLHNGSVPTLRDLLDPASKRPRVFYRGYDVYDPEGIGFIAQGSEAERIGTRHDVSKRGNANQGHEFGTHLSGEEKSELIEYLKTF